MSRKKNWREYLVAHATGWLDIATHYRILKHTIEILLVYIQHVQEKSVGFICNWIYALVLVLPIFI
jgi:hypothetical protein